MNRLTQLLLALTLLVLVAGCAKQAEIPPPTEAPPVPKIEKPAEPVKPEPVPVVEEVPEPDPLEVLLNDKNGFDVVYIDFDKAELRVDAKSVLRRHAEVIKANPGLKVLVEGHCDERGTEDYNLALGERRATRVKEYLVSLGVGDAILRTISYGETQPKAAGGSEDAWSQNRRARFQLSRAN